MSQVVELFRKHLPPRAKRTPSGWMSFNAVCCHNRGESHDDRKRGGVLFSEGFTYHCFNCGFSASWKPGRPVSQKLRNLMTWLGAPDDDINKMVFEAMKTEAPDYTPEAHPIFARFPEKQLPEGSMTISDWIEAEVDDAEVQEKLAQVVDYLIQRGFDPLDKNFWWSPADGFKDRLVIPFLYDSKTVGYTARKVTNGKPKYLSDQSPHFVFNIDSVTEDQRYVFVCEGPFDALSLGGIALLHNEISDEQARLINKLNKTVIVVPDQDEPGLKLIADAEKNGYHVAFPNWEQGIKDAADAVEKYGSIFVITDAINTAVAGSVKIQLYKKKLEKQLKNPTLQGSL